MLLSRLPVGATLATESILLKSESPCTGAIDSVESRRMSPASPATVSENNTLLPIG